MTGPHAITVRKVKFEFPDELDDVLAGADPVRESCPVAFSLTMPYLDPYLIRTFRFRSPTTSPMPAWPPTSGSSSGRKRSTSRITAGSTRFKRSSNPGLIDPGPIPAPILSQYTA